MVPSLKLTAIKKQIPSKKHYQRLTAAFLDMRDMLVTDQAGTHVAACMRGPRAS